MQGVEMGSGTNWSVTEDGARVTVTDHAGERRSLALSELTGVAIETKDTGPFQADLWWLLFGSDQRVALLFPQDAEGQKEVVDRLMALPGFDFNAMIEAMGSTDNAVFPLWRPEG